VHRSELVNDTDYTILQRYQGVLRGLYNYYCMAVNISRRMSTIQWILRRSMTKTLALKHKCKVTEILRRFQTRLPGPESRKVFQVIVERPGKKPLIATFGGIPF